MELEMKKGAALSLPKGYQQTEVGLIPEDWSLEPIEDFASITTGGSDTQDRVDNGMYPFYVRSNTIERINKYSFDGEAILTSGDGVGVGKIFHYVTGKFDYHQRVYNIYNYRENVAGKYLFFQFSTNFYDKVMSMTAKSSVDSVRREMIADMLIPLPPTLAEQKAIATALSDVDDLISSLDALIAKKKSIKQGAMQQLLTPPHKGGKRLDGFDGEWERKEVQKFINVGRGGSPRPIQDYITNSPDGVNWIKIGDTSKLSKYITSSKEKIIREGEVLSRAVKVGDFLLSNSMSFGRPYILKIDGCIHDGWLVLQDYQDYFDIDFLYYTLMSKDVFDQYLQKASGSGVLNLNKELVKVVELNRPKDLKEQKAIAQILSDMDEELEELATKKEKYEHIKQGMMQELLTGKTRLV